MSDFVLKPEDGKLSFEWLGRRDYGSVLDLQRTIFSKRVELKRDGDGSPQDRILFVEHDPVITLGKHAHRENVLFSRESLASRGIGIFEIERGGDVTYHGPGQLVVYPIIDLERYRIGVKDYVNLLEESVIRTIAEYGIKGERVAGASGVWIGKGTVNERKICALGVKVSRFITMHGLALNVNTDLDAFTLINPCGFTDKGVTSISRETGKEFPLHEVAVKLAGHLESLLKEQDGKQH